MTQTESKPAAKNRLPLFILFLGLLLVLLPLLVKGFRVNRLITSLQTHQTTAEKMMAAGIDQLKEDEVVTLAHGVRADTANLVSELEPLLPFAPYLRWLPRVGPLMPVAPELLAIADSGTALMVSLVDGLSPVLPIINANETVGMEQLPEILAILDEAKPKISQANQQFAVMEDNLVLILDQPDVVEALPWTVRENLPTIQSLLPLAGDGLKIAGVLPELAGQGGNKTYLLIAQNDDEIRPTGGFISGAGPVQISDGTLVDMQIADAYSIDDYLNKPYEFPPDPINEFMNIELFLFRDANYWPDFPTSAEKLMELYTYGKDIPLDGVIAIDQNFLYDLVELLEPIDIPELEISITGETVQSFIQEAWATGDEEGDWRTTRKSFLGPMANGIRNKLENDIFSVDLIALADLIQESIHTKSLQIFIADPKVGGVMSDIGWDGSVQAQESEDMLLIVDHNMGTNKVNHLISTEIEYNITLQADGSGQAITTVIYNHNGTDRGEPCSAEQTRYVRGLQYSELVNLCYWNYVRLYVPLGSQLQQSTKHEIPAEQMLTGREWAGVSRQRVDDQLGLTIFDNFLLIPWGQSQTLQSVYMRPDVWGINAEGKNEYTLKILKQAGQRPHPPITVTITLPEDSQLTAVQPQPTALDKSVIQFKTELDKDLEFSLKFR